MDITSMLQFGPKKTFVPAEDAPSIYADPTEWQAYRSRQMLDAALQTNQEMAAQNIAAQDEMTNQLLTDMAAGEDSMSREMMSLLGRYPTRAALSPQKSLPVAGDKDGTPDVPVGPNPTHAKQDLINKNWNDQGIQAFTDSKGQLVLTNKPGATNATEAMRPFTPVTSKATTGGAGNLLNDIRNAPDLAAAQGAMYALQSSITEQVAKTKSNAIKFAEQKVGLPAMQLELQNAIKADRADPMYKPGMGDSPITAKIRTQVTALEDQAAQEAERWLSRNVEFAQLSNTLTAAQQEIQRFTRKEDWKEQRKLSSELQAEEWDRRKTEDINLKAGQIPIETKNRILSLHPEIATEENPNAKILGQYEQIVKKGGKAANDALNAPAAQLPALAVRGNAMAEELVIQQEMKATGEGADAIRGRIASAKALMADPKFVQKALSAKFASSPDKTKQVKQATEEFNKLSNNPEEKERFNQMKADLALDFIRTTATERFASDLSRLQTTNVKLGDAVRLAIKNTGSASLENVATAWLGDATGPEAKAGYDAFMATLESESLKFKDSMFGTPNMVAIRAAVTEMARAKLTVMGRLKSAVGMMGRDTHVPGSMVGSFDITGSKFKLGE